MDRLNSLVSEKQSFYDSIALNKNSGVSSKNKADESNNELNNLLDELEDDDVTPSHKVKASSRYNNFKEAKSIMIGKLDNAYEETKHEPSVSDSINAEIEDLLRNSLHQLPSNKIVANNHRHIRNYGKGLRSSKKSTFNLNNVSRQESNNSDMERLASMILRENSQNTKKSMFNSKSEKNTVEEGPYKVYKNNMDNQPNERMLKARKAAAQYCPYGVFSQQNGGLGTKSPKYYIRSNLLFYNKYDKRLVAEVLSEGISKNKHFKRGCTVIIVGEISSKILICPITSDVENKNSASIELTAIGKTQL